MIRDPPESGNHESGARKFLLVIEDVPVARWVSIVCVCLCGGDGKA